MNRFFELLEEHKLTPNQFYILFGKNEKHPIRTLPGQESEFIYLLRTGFLDSAFTVTGKGKELLEAAAELFKPRKGSKKKAKEIALTDADKVQVRAYRELFPTIRPAGRNKPLRSNQAEVERKFLWFFKEYPQYTWDEIMRATINYLRDQYDNNQYTYAMTDKYFICKQDKNAGEIRSDLASYCENLREVAPEPEFNFGSIYKVS